MAKTAISYSQSVFGAEGTERGSGNKELAFGWLNRFQFHIAVLLASFIDLDLQVINLASFGLNSSGRTNALGGFLEGARLPIGADLMIAGIHGKEKIRLAFVGSDPRAIEPHSHCGTTLNILEDVDEGLATIRGCHRMLLLVRLYVEIRLAGAAAATGRRRWWRVLRQDRNGENRQENGGENSSHHNFMTLFRTKWFPAMVFQQTK